MLCMQIYIIVQNKQTLYICHIVFMFQWCILGWLQLFFLVKSLPAVHPCVLHVPAVLMKNRHLSVYSKETIINNLTVTGLTIILICEIKEKNHAARKRGLAILQL
jgi:hypothetical protein